MSQRVGAQRVYQFIDSRYGIENLRNRRLKVSIIEDLNDPFEFFSIDLSDKDVRRAFQQMRSRLSRTRGIHCFSRDWQNPVLWSHYAEKHRGICLGFDVPLEFLVPIDYVHSRAKWAVHNLLALEDGENALRLLFCKKYIHWRYEAESRLFVSLEKPDENGLHFTSFSESLRLREVIVGPMSTLPREVVREAVGESGRDVAVFKARLAFRSFRVVRNQDQSLWV